MKFCYTGWSYLLLASALLILSLPPTVAAVPVRRFGVCEHALSAHMTLLPMRTDKMGENYRGLKRIFRGQNVQYLSLRKRRGFEVYFSDGLLVTAAGEPVTRRGMYVVNEDGSLIVVEVKPKDFFRLHHSSLSAGQDVYCAGEIEVQNGVVTHVDNLSGHYLPSVDQFSRFVAYLLDRGVRLTPAAVSPSYGPLVSKYRRSDGTPSR